MATFFNIAFIKKIEDKDIKGSDYFDLVVLDKEDAEDIFGKDMKGLPKDYCFEDVISRGRIDEKKFKSLLKEKIGYVPTTYSKSVDFDGEVTVSVYSTKEESEKPIDPNKEIRFEDFLEVISQDPIKVVKLTDEENSSCYDFVGVDSIILDFDYDEGDYSRIRVGYMEEDFADYVTVLTKDIVKNTIKKNVSTEDQEVMFFLGKMVNALKEAEYRDEIPIIVRG